MVYGGDNMFAKLSCKFPFKFPAPGPMGGPVVDLLITGAKKLWDKLTNSKTSEEISCRDKFNYENIGDIIYYNKILNEFIIEIEEEISIIEEKIILECTEYYEELILLIKAVEDSKKINLQSKNIGRYIEKLQKDTKGYLVKSIHRNISLDNEKLKKVLILPAGELKRNRLEQFKNNTIKQVMNDFISDIKISLEDLSENISNDLNLIISDISNNNIRLLNELTILENSKNNEEKAKELLELTKEKIILCNEIINKVRK